MWGNEGDGFDTLLLSANDNYSVETIADLLWQTGLLQDYSIQFDGKFIKLVFTHGNKKEVYSKQELDFISKTEDVIVFSNYYKLSPNGMVPCRIIATRATKSESISFSIAFTKIVSKAIKGFNICIIVLEEGVIITCNSFDKTQHNDYYISNIIDSDEAFEEVCDSLMYSSSITSFSEYYSYIKCAINYKLTKYSSDPKSWDPYKLTYAYIDELRELEASIGIDFSSEIRRCLWGEEHESSEHSDSFAVSVAEADESLFKIESSTINSIELLLEADDIMKKAIENEMRNEAMIKDEPYSVKENNKLDSEVIELLNDPEAMIKRLKKEQGI